MRSALALVASTAFVLRALGLNILITVTALSVWQLS